MWNMFKVNNKDTETTLLAPLNIDEPNGVFYLYNVQIW